MKRYSFFLLIVILLTSCAPAGPEPTAAVTASPTRMPTITPSPTFTPTSTVTPWPIPDNVIFCLDKVGSESEKNTIQESIRKAHQYFVEELGVKPDPAILFAGPDLNKLPGENECSDNSQLQRIRRDLRSSWDKTGGYAVFGVQVTNTDYFVWKDNVSFRKFTVAHEYVHQLQMTLLGRGISGDDAGPRWLLEGSAQVIGYYSQGSDLTANDIYWEQNRDNIPPSAHLGSEGNYFWDIAPLAVGYLISIAPDNVRSIANYFSYNPNAITWKSAFEKAFGLTFEKFNDQFEVFRKMPSTPMLSFTSAPSLTPTLVPAGMVAIKGKVILADPSQKFSDYIVSFCNSKIVQCLPGNFISEEGLFTTYLNPGDYKMSVNPLDGGEALGWYTENGLYPDPSCAKLIQVGDQGINITVDFHPAGCVMEAPTQAIGTVRIQGNVILKDGTQSVTRYGITTCKLHIVQDDGQNTMKCSSGFSTWPDGSFILDLTPGKYWISLNSMEGSGEIAWYFMDSLVKQPQCGNNITVDQNRNVSVIIDPDTINVCR